MQCIYLDWIELVQLPYSPALLASIGISSSWIRTALTESCEFRSYSDAKLRVRFTISFPQRVEDFDSCASVVCLTSTLGNKAPQQYFACEINDIA